VPGFIDCPRWPAVHQNFKPLIELNSPSIKPKPRLSSSLFCPGTELVAQIEFTEWTPDGHLRHSKFVGLREDKEAREVVREDSKFMADLKDRV
jgi:bifunctional non-homologous end joining protein LigD